MTCSLIINHLKVEGVYCFEQKFVTGVNFISGENSLGKTNLIKTIIYGLGGNDPNFAPEIKDNTTYVFLEISINDSIFTIQREIKRPGAKIKFFDKPLADIKSHDPDYKFLDPDESFSKLILNKLNLEEKLYYRSSKPNPGDKPIRLSFKELFRYFYIRQSDGYSAILNKQPERPRTKCFEYLLDLKTQDSLELENIVKELGNRKEAINRDLNYLNQLLLELGINDDNLIINRNEQINQKLKEFINKREAFRIRIEKEQKAFVEEGRYNNLKSELDKISNQINLVRKNIEELNINILEIEKNIKIKTMNISQFDRIDKFSSHLKDFPIKKCPICYQEIDDLMLKRNNDGLCILCNRELLIEKTINLDKEINNISEEIKDLDILLSRRKQEMIGEKNNLGILIEIQNQKLTEIEEITKHYNPKLDEFEAIIKEISLLEAEKNQINYLLRIFDKKRGLNDQLIKITNELLEMKEKLKTAKEMEDEDRKKIDFLKKYLEEFLIKSNFRDFHSVKIDKSYLPLINERELDTFSDSQRIRAIIAYYYAFLKFSLEHECNYPRFLIIDSPKQQDIADLDLDKILEVFSELNNSKKLFQLIVTTTVLPSKLKNLEILHLKDYLAHPC